MQYSYTQTKALYIVRKWKKTYFLFQTKKNVFKLHTEAKIAILSHIIHRFNIVFLLQTFICAHINHVTYFYVNIICTYIYACLTHTFNYCLAYACICCFLVCTFSTLPHELSNSCMCA